MRPLFPARPRTRGARRLARSLSRPVLGYAGFINEHRIDLELVAEIARRHPQATVLFLGPVQLDFDRRFPQLPNIRFHPAVPYDVLQDYLMVFDVSLIPHARNPHTAGNNPLKLYDYLTTGRPVISTRIAGLAGFEDVVTVVDSREAFLDAVQSALDHEPDAVQATRLERAAENHWEVRARAAARVIDAALGGATAVSTC